MIVLSFLYTKTIIFVFSAYMSIDKFLSFSKIYTFIVVINTYNFIATSG